MDDELLAYYDEIRRLAEAKSDSREEAEDLLSETFLAAFAYRHNGGVIEHPKTYLVHTLISGTACCAGNTGCRRS